MSAVTGVALSRKKDGDALQPRTRQGTPAPPDASSGFERVSMNALGLGLLVLAVETPDSAAQSGSARRSRARSAAARASVSSWLYARW